MLRTILKYGVIAGLVVGGFEIVIFTFFSGMPPLKYGMLLGYATMLIALSAVFVGIKRHRDVDRGGVDRLLARVRSRPGRQLHRQHLLRGRLGSSVQAMMDMDFASALFERDPRERKGEGRERRGACEDEQPRWRRSRSSTPTRCSACR